MQKKEKNEEKTDAVAVAPATLAVMCREQGVNPLFPILHILSKY